MTHKNLQTYDDWLAEYSATMEVEYTFIIDDQTITRTPLEYLADPDLQTLVSPSSKKRMHRLYLGHTVIALTPEFYDQGTLHGGSAKGFFDHYRHEQKLNPLRFFAPSGTSALAFLNDQNHDMKILRAPNRCGKTATAMVDLVLHMCDLPKDWPIFTQHGVKHREWAGPCECGAASYTSGSLQKSVWTEFVKWVPNDQLGEYGIGPNGKRKRSYNSKDPYLELECGSDLKCHTYRQSGEAAVGAVYKRFLFDEQPPEFFFDEIAERFTTVMGGGTISATPHKVEGRPDTGAGHLMQALETGVSEKGLDISTYVMQVGDVTDWVMPNEAKRKKYQKWIIEPVLTNNVKAQREGRSRFLGEYHETSGLVYDEWDSRIHIISPEQFKLNDDMTRYRAIDHGVNNPTACVWAAVTSDFDIIIYDEYYQRDYTIHQNVANIIDVSGNLQAEQDPYEDIVTGSVLKRYEEREDHTKFAKTVMDPRSFAKQLDTMKKTIGWMYKASGLSRVRPAGTAQATNSIPMVKELLRVNEKRQHLVTGEPGAPRLYIMSNCHEFIREINGYVWKTTVGRVDDKNHAEKPQEKNDHLMDALKYLAQIPPRYMGSVLPGDRDPHGRTVELVAHDVPVRSRDVRTGY